MIAYSLINKYKYKHKNYALNLKHSGKGEKVMVKVRALASAAYVTRDSQVTVCITTSSCKSAATSEIVRHFSEVELRCMIE